MALTACEDMGGRRMPVAEKQPSGPGETTPATTGEVRRGSSTLGKARDSAVGVVRDDVAEHNRRIEEAAEGVGK
jgi:hypothetical protein